MWRIKENEIDDVFMYQFKSNMLLFLLLLWLGFLIWGLNLESSISSNSKKILSQKFFIMKINESYLTSEKINKDTNFWKIDVLTANQLLKFIWFMKNKLSQSWNLKQFWINIINFTRRWNNSTKINFSIDLNDKDKTFNLLNYFKNNNILSKDFSISYQNGIWKFRWALQIYYKWKLSPQILTKFKEIEVKPKSKSKSKSK